ncbi:MAG: hydrogenase expression/formation protein HypC [Thermofilum sp.]|jgi:hydrogenase expression/formation protein HypC|nr:hydrogenase expression/formation protein HypC [Thermofilum sp.]
MCWGTPAVVLELSQDGSIAKVDYGDGVVREVFVGITEEKLSRGDIVMVHAGVIISKLTPEGLREEIEFINGILQEAGESENLLAQLRQNVIELAEKIKSGNA